MGTLISLVLLPHTLQGMCNVYVCMSPRRVEHWAVELQTKFREDFTITEIGDAKIITNWRGALRIYANQTALCMWASQFHFYLLWVNACLSLCLKVLAGALNKEKALLRLYCESKPSFAALAEQWPLQVITPGAAVWPPVRCAGCCRMWGCRSPAGLQHHAALQHRSRNNVPTHQRPEPLNHSSRISD